MKKLVIALAVLLVVAAVVTPATAQQYFQKWDMYAGYSYLNTPSKDLTQNGYNLSFGHNVNKWMALGLDISRFYGSAPQPSTGADLAKRISPSLLAGLPAPLLKALPGVKVSLPVDASTATFAAGTQFQLRKNKWVTPFFRPFVGAFHGRAVGDPTKVTITSLPAGVTPTQIAAVLGAIPTSVMKNAVTQSETVLGYGFGGGVDLNITKPIGIRFATDFIHTSLFGDTQNNIRIATGLIYRFGGPVTTK